MQQYLQNKKGLVENVFNKVYDKYDLMNDFMSFGVHRIWKKNLISWMNPSFNKKLVDVACGTGDLGKLFLDFTNKSNEIFCVDPNKNMINKGKERFKNNKNFKWILASAENLPLEENLFDYQMKKSIEIVNKKENGVIVIINGNYAPKIEKQFSRQKNEQKDIFELREYGVGAQILRSIGLKEIILLSSVVYIH